MLHKPDISRVSDRARRQEFPDIISDDTFVRLSFTPQERMLASAPYDWPLVEGFANLVKVRRRQDAGVVELKDLHPALFDNDDKPRLGLLRSVRLALRDPFGFAVYAAVSLVVRFTKKDADTSWVRGR
jgi:hypothetical protein